MLHPVPGHESVKYIELEHKSLATGWCYGHKWIIHPITEDINWDDSQVHFGHDQCIYTEKNFDFQAF